MDAYVTLAKRVIHAHVCREDFLETELPDELTQQRTGTFVTIHRKDGSLRGCIGTILPTKENLAKEIIANAKSAATMDPRFPEVLPQELPDLEISVDVLSEPEPIVSYEDLDPKVYGVIVMNANRMGVLLPDLEGIDTIEEQLSIACRKAGIDEDEKFDVCRFTVTRHHEDD